MSPAILAVGNYSSSEVATSYKWVDGKTIYKKTISIGSLPNNNTKNVAHGITGLQTVVSMFGAAISSGLTFPIPSARSNNPQIASIGLWIMPTEVVVEAGDNRTSYIGYVTIFYTKS